MTDHDVAALLQSLVDSIARASTRLTARARAVFDAFIGVTTSGYDAPAMAYVRVRSERERAAARYLR